MLSLGRIGGKNATTALMMTLNEDEDPEVRWRAVMALGCAGDREVIPLLQNSLQTEVEEGVKEHILEAIRSLEGKMEVF